MIAADPTVADMPVDVLVQGGRVLVAREEPVARAPEPLSKDAMEAAERILRDGSMKIPHTIAQPAPIEELRNRGFIYYQWTSTGGRSVVLSEDGLEFLRAYRKVT